MDKDNTEEEAVTMRKPKNLLWVAGLVSPDKMCFSIVTTASQGSSVEWLHGRVPLLLTDPVAWLKEGKNPLPSNHHNPSTLTEKNKKPDVGQPLPAQGQGKDGLAWHRVGAEVGSVKNHGPQLCKPYVEKSRLLTSFFGNPDSTLPAGGHSLSTTDSHKPAKGATADTTQHKRKREAPTTPATPSPKKAKTVKSNTKITSFFKQT
jgi:hypothetical protein